MPTAGPDRFFESLAVTEAGYRASSAGFQVFRSMHAARRVLHATGKLPDAGRADALEPWLASVPSDPCSTASAPLRLRHDPTSDTLTIYSIGPDQHDDNARITYILNSSAAPPGDIMGLVSREPKFPFPPHPLTASTTESVFRQFPSGLPLDVFADTKTKGLNVVQTTGPVYIFSYGPDTDESTVPSNGYIPDTPYDPTNGIISRGDLFIELPPE